MNSRIFALLLFSALPCFLWAQDPTGAIEGVVSDESGSVLESAHIKAKNLDTGLTRETATGDSGLFRLSLLPIGRYSLTVEAPKFGTLVRQPITVNIGQTVRLELELDVATVQATVNVIGDAPLVDATTNTLGAVVTAHEILELPLNGRNFTQLGLLQAGAAPLTGGLTQAGGPMRQGETYSVNGARPEQNNYTVDGGQNVNRMDGGFALKIPVDAIAEFRILTETAPAEYGGTAGATTAVVTKSGSNELHGDLYEFLRNDKLDTRNFFASKVEPLKQNQFGGTIGGPVVKDKLFFFGYYEGFRNKQGLTTTSVVPTAQDRTGNFSDLGTPLLNLAAGGKPFAGNTIPSAAINPIAVNVLNLYPQGNISPSLYRATVVGTNFYDQAGGRVDFNRSETDQLFARYAFSGGYDINPVSVRGTTIPGFPTRDNLTTHSAEIADTHMFSATATNSARVTFLRYLFEFDRRLNQTPPSALGFQYSPASELGQGPPFFNIVGYSPVGGAITGPRDSAQNSYQAQESFAWIKRAHSMRFGAEYLRTQINMFQAIAPNAFFVFATFPTNNAIANVLLGAPVTFYQGLGDFHRGLRDWSLGTYAQDEWRVTARLTLNYGIRYERVNPFTEIRNRVNGFVPGVQSHVFPDAPAGLVFPGDPGIAGGIAHGDSAFMPRAGFAWDPTGSGKWAVRAAYGVFYDQFQNGPGVSSQVPVSSLPWAQFDQISGAGVNFANPYIGHPYPGPNTFIKPSTVFAMDPTARAPYVQDWNFGIQRSFASNYVLEVRYVGSKGTHLPRNIEANPAIYGPGATAQNADQRRIYAGCPAPGTGPCTFSTIAELADITNSTYEAGQATLTRRFANGLQFNVSYWFSKTLDYHSSMNLAGASSQPLAGENDLAQNPLNLAAEHGPSLFDSRHRAVGSATWQPRVHAGASLWVRRAFDGWGLNVIATHNSATPYTVYDSTNVSLQANSPPISGIPASRPNAVADPNDGPHALNHWLNASAFQRLNPLTQAGQFGNAGRNIARGPAFTDLDAALTRTFAIGERTNLQFRAESFNIANHPNFGLPVADMNSPNFNQILTAGAPRLMQFALKLMF